MNLKYKGSRNYLQGGDIYNAIVDSLASEFGGHAMCIRNQIKLVLNESRIPEETLEKAVAFYAAAKKAKPRLWSGSTRNWQPIEEVGLNPEKVLNVA